MMSLTGLSQLGALHDVRSGQSLTPDALASQILARADDWRGAGMRAGDRVLRISGEGVDFVIDLLALWQVEASVAVLSPQATLAEQAVMTDLLRPAFAVTGAGVEARADAKRGAPGEALILFTSGTTGDPKGVVLTQEALSARISANLAEMPFDEIQRTLSLLPLHFGHGLIGGLLTPLLGGAEIHLWTRPGIAELPRMAEVIAAREVTFLTSVPTLWSLLRKLGAPAPEKPLSRIHVGSAPLEPDLRTWIGAWSGAPVWNMYGMTEAANWIASGRGDRFDRSWGTRMAVLCDGNVSGSGTGEILLQGPSLMRGYLDRPDLTAEAFHQGWFRTGDLGALDPVDGLSLTGRLKTEINRAGIKIQPEEVERLATECPDVTAACCFGYPDQAMGHGVAVALVLAGDTGIEAIRDQMHTRLMADRLPDRWFAVDGLCLTDRGKVDRHAMRDRLMPETTSG